MPTMFKIALPNTKTEYVNLSRVPCVGEFIALPADGQSFEVTSVVHHAEGSSAMVMTTVHVKPA